MSEFLTTWAFSCSDEIKKRVESKHPEDMHRWPMVRSFKAEGYIWNKKFMAIILRNSNAQMPYIGNAENMTGDDIPKQEPSLDNLIEWQKYLREKFSVRSQDFAIILPIKDGNTVMEIWNEMTDAEKHLWDKQIQVNMEMEYNHVKGFDSVKGFVIPPGYKHLTDECGVFFKDQPEFDKNVFLMMKFGDEPKLKKVEEELREALIENGMNPLRADDKVYSNDRDLWNNVCVYMLCCKFGIAVLENYSKQEYNPNISIEYGFMRALNKNILLLADSEFPDYPADIVGKLREPFDSNDSKNSINNAVKKWVDSLKKQ